MKKPVGTSLFIILTNVLYSVQQLIDCSLTHHLWLSCLNPHLQLSWSRNQYPHLICCIHCLLRTTRINQINNNLLLCYSVTRHPYPSWFQRCCQESCLPRESQQGYQKKTNVMLSLESYHSPLWHLKALNTHSCLTYIHACASRCAKSKSSVLLVSAMTIIAVQSVPKSPNNGW